MHITFSLKIPVFYVSLVVRFSIPLCMMYVLRLLKSICNHNHIIAAKQTPAKATILRRAVNESIMIGVEAARVAAPLDVEEVDDPDAADVAADED